MTNYSTSNNSLPLTVQEAEIIVYEADSSSKLDVRLEDETVWLTQAQMTELFQTTRNNITLHIRNIFKEGELNEDSVCKYSLLTAADGKKYRTKLYSLDVIISVGYRVKSVRGTKFRQWANKVLKEHLLKGQAIYNRIDKIESRLAKTEEKVDFFINYSLPPIEGILFDGQIFDAYTFVNRLIRAAKTKIVLIDNYIDDSVLLQLENRNSEVYAAIYTHKISEKLNLDIKRHNAQYSPIDIKETTAIHDRFLIIDNFVYHIGASLKDLGKKLFAFSKLSFSPEFILSRL